MFALVNIKYNWRCICFGSLDCDSSLFGFQKGKLSVSGLWDLSDIVVWQRFRWQPNEISAWKALDFFGFFL